MPSIFTNLSFFSKKNQHSSKNNYKICRKKMKPNTAAKIKQKLKSGGEQFTFPATAKLWSTSTITLLQQKFQLQQHYFYLYCSILFSISISPLDGTAKKMDNFLMSTVTARALPSLKKFSYNDNKHDTLTIYYYYKIPCQFLSACQKNTPLPFYSLCPPTLPLLLSNKTEKNFFWWLNPKFSSFFE